MPKMNVNISSEFETTSESGTSHSNNKHRSSHAPALLNPSTHSFVWDRQCPAAASKISPSYSLPARMIMRFVSGKPGVVSVRGLSCGTSQGYVRPCVEGLLPSISCERVLCYLFTVTCWHGVLFALFNLTVEYAGRVIDLTFCLPFIANQSSCHLPRVSPAFLTRPIPNQQSSRI